MILSEIPLILHPWILLQFQLKCKIYFLLLIPSFLFYFKTFELKYTSFQNTVIIRSSALLYNSNSKSHKKGVLCCVGKLYGVGGGAVEPGLDVAVFGGMDGVCVNRRKSR